MEKTYYCYKEHMLIIKVLTALLTAAPTNTYNYLKHLKVLSPTVASLLF